MSEPKIFDMHCASLFPAVLRSVRDYVGFRVWLSPAQVTAYADMNAIQQCHRFLMENTIAGFPCFVDPSFPKDRIDFVGPDGQVLARMVNLAIPVGYTE